MKFRIVRDGAWGYSVQLRWFGIYRQISENTFGTFGSNTWKTVEDAKKFIDTWSQYVISEQEKKKRLGSEVERVEITNEDIVAWKLKGKL
jgi:hypothetical protein